MVSDHPIQPVEDDGTGVHRFKANKIVRYLIDLTTQRGICDMNALAIMPFSAEDRMQFAQLIGYSVCGYHELSYVTDKSADEASRLSEQLTPPARR